MVQDNKIEQWAFVPNFPEYMISDEGQIYSCRCDRLINVSPNTYGHMRIALTNYTTNTRHERSLAKLVATVFVEPPNNLCDCVVILDGVLSNVVKENLVWRPRWFVWKYARQLKTELPTHFYNLRVRNINTGNIYSSIIEAGMVEGLLFNDVWKSTYNNNEVFPNVNIFEIC